MTNYSILNSPLGDLTLVANESKLTGIYFKQHRHAPTERKNWTLAQNHPVLQKAAKQLREYFDGKRDNFTLPLNFSGTDFQKKVWRQIARIPFGKTTTYSDIARKAGKPLAIRAAGTATGRNPISIIVPCHRVMGKNGAICGYAGGLDKKRHLLALEKSLDGKSL